MYIIYAAYRFKNVLNATDDITRHRKGHLKQK